VVPVWSRGRGAPHCFWSLSSASHPIWEGTGRWVYICGSVPMVGWVSHGTAVTSPAQLPIEGPLWTLPPPPCDGARASRFVLALNFAFSPQKLILSETTIFDVLPVFFYHTNQVVRMAALEVRAGGPRGPREPQGVAWLRAEGAGAQRYPPATPLPPPCQVYVRRGYIAYELNSLQHRQLSDGTCLVEFQFMLPSSHPNRYRGPPRLARSPGHGPFCKAVGFGLSPPCILRGSCPPCSPFACGAG